MWTVSTTENVPDFIHINLWCVLYYCWWWRLQFESWSCSFCCCNSVKCMFAALNLRLQLEKMHFAVTTFTFAARERREGQFCSNKIKFAVTKLRPVLAVTNSFGCKRTNWGFWRYKSVIELQICHGFFSCKTEMKFHRCTVDFVLQNRNAVSSLHSWFYRCKTTYLICNCKSQAVAAKCTLGAANLFAFPNVHFAATKVFTCSSRVV